MPLTIYTDAHYQHNPPHEFLEGKLIDYTESPSRAEIIIDAVKKADFGEIIAPRDFGLEPILAVHAADYVEFLRTIYDEWTAIGGTDVAAMPAIFPRQGFERMSPTPYARMGQYSFDMSVPITRTSYGAILGAANCALTGAEEILNGQKLVYALCRPPGHHAYSNMGGGFCYLNNAAIAADYLVKQKGARVALLDIDVHHGNGTQSIFYDRADVLFVSIHGSPEWEYPYFAGYADETGSGAGEGYTVNYPLEKRVQDTEYLAVLDDALERIRSYQPDYVVLSAGFDTYDGDPLGQLALTTAAYPAMGERIRALGLPVLVVQEGGYTVAKLGENAVALLKGLAR